MNSQLDNPENYKNIRSTLDSKPGLKSLYLEVYERYSRCLARCPKEGIALEVGSGGGFAKEIIPELTTSDIIAYPNIDRVVDATKMPFEDRSVRGIFLFNVLHHISDTDKFFSECVRVLKPGGRICITDQFPGWISKPILKYVHHEEYDEDAKEWRVNSTGPLSGANGALPWIVFFRDLNKFNSKFPELRIETREYHTPLRYWLSGGLRSWNLLPAFLFQPATLLDKSLVEFSHQFASFFTIELVKQHEV